MKAEITVLLFFTLMTTVASSGHVSKRSDDQSPLEPVVMKMSADLTALTATVNALQAKLDVESRRTAFFAQFSNAQAVTPASGPFMFDHVVFNDGNTYDPTMGVFTAPFAGVYLISVKLYLRGTQTSHPHTDIMLNGHTLDRMGFDFTAASAGHGDNSHSTTLPVKLQAGDKVWVQTTSRHEYNIWGGYDSFFSGVLIAAD